MNPESSQLFTNLLCMLPFCFVGLFMLGGLGLLMWLFNKKQRPKSQAELAAEEAKMRAVVDGLMAKLRPWTPEALSDLSTDWDASWSKFRRLNVKGTLPGLSEPKEGAWVAFNLNVRAAGLLDGRLLAKTTAQTFFYRIVPRKEITIQVDGAPWGSVQPDGTLLDAEGQPIGDARRPDGTPFAFSMGNISHIRDKRQRDYPITLRGRVIARLANPSAQLVNAISLKKRQYPPALTLNDSPSEEEATWLLALAILQVAGYNTQESIFAH